MKRKSDDNLLGHSLVESGIMSDATDLAGDALHALLALHHGHVDVLDASQQVRLGLWAGRRS